MPVYSIKAPNGLTYDIEGPEGATDEQVQAEVLRQYPEANGEQVLTGSVGDDGTLDPEQYSTEERARIDAEGNWKLDPTRGKEGVGLYVRPDADPATLPLPRDDSRINGLSLGISKPFDNAAKWLADVPGFKQVDEFGQWIGLPGAKEAAEQNQKLRENNTRWGMQLAGNIVGTLPLAALPGGAFTQGAAGGALLSDADTLGGVATDAAFGAIGGKVGDVALRGAAQTIAPRLSPELRTLIDAGVEVTPGQMARSGEGLTNRLIASAEDKLTSVPVTGDVIKNARVNSIDSFSKAAVNRALEPIGKSLPADLRGRRAIAFAGDELSAAYDALLPRLSARGDQRFVDDLADIHTEAGNMLPDRQEQFNRILGGLGRYWRDGVDLDGRALKEIETRIGERVRRAAMSTDADQRELGDRLGDVLAAVRDLAARQNPAEAEALGRINQGWKSLTQVERAGGNSKGQITPNGYSQAVKQSSDTARRRGYARGEALNQDLADAASAILPSEVPDSGTAGRMLSADMLNPLTLGTVLLTAPPTAAAQALTKVQTRNVGQGAQMLGDLLRLGAPFAGQTGAAVTASSIHTLGN